MRLIFKIIFILALANAEVSAALRVHKAPLQEMVNDINADYKPELAQISGRGRDEQLSSAIDSIVKNKMKVHFIDDSLKNMRVNWSSDSEPLQVLLTKISRIYGLDVVLNSVTESIYIGVDTGQCDMHREATLFKTKKQWETVGISNMPTLPIYLPVYLDASGFEWRLC